MIWLGNVGLPNNFHYDSKTCLWTSIYKLSPCSTLKPSQIITWYLPSSFLPGVIFKLWRLNLNMSPIPDLDNSYQATLRCLAQSSQWGVHLYWINRQQIPPGTEPRARLQSPPWSHLAAQSTLPFSGGCCLTAELEIERERHRGTIDAGVGLLRACQ